MSGREMEMPLLKCDSFWFKVKKTQKNDTYKWFQLVFDTQWHFKTSRREEVITPIYISKIAHLPSEIDGFRQFCDLR